VGPASGAASGGVASTTDVSNGAGMAFGSSGGTANDGLTAIEAGGDAGKRCGVVSVTDWHRSNERPLVHRPYWAHRYDANGGAVTFRHFAKVFPACRLDRALLPACLCAATGMRPRIKADRKCAGFIYFPHGPLLLLLFLKERLLDFTSAVCFCT
jgi:hypothetical protein